MPIIPISSSPQITPPATTKRSSEGKIQSPFAPLAIPIFTAFWCASIFSNMGTWIHDVGSGWLMTTLNSTPEMVTAVRVAMAVPMTLLAIPAGMFVDRFDRRRLLIATQWTLLVCAAALSWLTWTETVSSTWLLLLTFCSGIAMVLHVLTWQAAIPKLVPREQLSRAIALGSISFNLARSIGPAIGGLLIAYVGIWSTFATNAMSFAGVLLVLVFWKPEHSPNTDKTSSIRSIQDGFAHVIDTIELRNTLVRLSTFVLPASAFWALLPLVIRQRLLWDERGYGFVVTLMGMGAVAAAFFLHRTHNRFGMNATTTVAMFVYAIGLMIVGSTTSGTIVSSVALVMGSAWMMALTTLSSSMQISVSDRLRGRGMSFYYASLAGSMALGSFLWGQVAGTLGLGVTIQIASVTMMTFAILGHWFPISFPVIGVGEPSE